MSDHTIERDGVELSLTEEGNGGLVVLLHGLTATRGYVVMGSSALQRAGHRVVAYDARGHGRSSPAEDAAAYGYDELVADLGAVLDASGGERAVLAGASMGAHTAAALALRDPERVAGLVLVTPAFDPGAPPDPRRMARWQSLADGLRHAGVEGFMRAFGEPAVPERWRETVLKVVRQRLSEHEHPAALADALEVVPRSSPFADMAELEEIEAPAVVVASHDEVDPEHPYEVGEAWAEAIPGARLVSEDPGASPLAWQGGQLSQVIVDAAAAAART